MIGELVLSQDFNFIVREIRFQQIGALLQHNNAEAVGRKFLGKNAAGSARADDYKIDFVGSLVFRLIGHYFFSASRAAGCQPG